MLISLRGRVSLCCFTGQLAARDPSVQYSVLCYSNNQNGRIFYANVDEELMGLDSSLVLWLVRLQRVTSWIFW